MSFTMNYPVVAPSNTVVLPDPTFGDIERVTTGSILNKLISSELRSLNVTGRVDKYVWQYKMIFGDCAANDLVGDIRDFLIASAAAIIEIVDHEAATREGLIITPIVDIIEVRDDEVFDMTFQFLVVP